MFVSILTPAYNVERYVAETIRSVQAQTVADWEMILVDDCSTDATASVIETFTSDARIRLVRNEVNAGAAAARSRALQESRGRYVAFVDGDDVWLPEKLERQLEFMRTSGAGLSFTSLRRMSADGSRIGHIIPVPRALSYHQLLGNTAITTSTVVLDREATGAFDFVDGYRNEDFIVWLTLLRRGVVARGLNEDLLRYRVLPRSLSRNKVRSVAAVWRIYREHQELSLPASAWYLANYAVRAAWKYRRL
jgi:teichuronic acid biosynthesis glycosyltransferase TuaG